MLWYGPEPGTAWTGGVGGVVGVAQFSRVCFRGSGKGEVKRMAGSKDSGNGRTEEVDLTKAHPLKTAKSGHPDNSHLWERLSPCSKVESNCKSPFSVQYFRGKDLKKLYASGVPDEIYRGRDFPFIIIAPQCPEHLRWSTDYCFENLHQKITVKYRIDPDRIYLTGFSLGGSMIGS